MLRGAAVRAAAEVRLGGQPRARQRPRFHNLSVVDLSHPVLHHLLHHGTMVVEALACRAGRDGVLASRRSLLEVIDL